MKTREEIELKVGSYLDNWSVEEQRQMLILEVLLDIRDLLTHKNTE